ncbi:MAG: SufE family protein [Pseudoxanthomonas sp.]|nr:SufE family protein [Pseudoxanthomonas sp.]
MSARAREEQQRIAGEFALFGDWSERYQYLIDLGRSLPPFPDAWRDEAHRIHGCQSMVWLVAEGDASALTLHAGSDSVIVSGLIALVLRVYSGLPAADIVATEPDFIHAIGLGSHLSPTRSNGLAALLARVKALAGRAAAGEVLVAPPR